MLFILKKIIQKLKLRSIITAKVLDNVFLNLFGIQIFRIIIGRMILIIKRIFLNIETDEDVKQLIKDGILIIPEFLSDDDFKRVRYEYYQNLESENFEHNYQPSRGGVGKLTLSGNSISSFTQSTLLDNAKIISLFKWGQGKTILFNKCTFEKSIYDPKVDAQQKFHRDNFYSTHKAFFYIEDVDVTDSPLCYVKGSNKITFLRILHEYINGLSRYKNKTLRSVESGNTIINWIQQRIKSNEFSAVGEKNTLVIADTFGYHRRGDLSLKSSRSIIRFNP